MPGPAPKHPSSRARRNRPAAGDWITLPADPYEGPRPDYEPPTPYLAEVWESWWSSPMAHMWPRSDWPFLVMLIQLMGAGAESDGRTLAEIRQWSDKFGLTPEGRQKRRWMLPDAEVDEEGRVVERTSNLSRRERILKAVEG